VIPIHPYHTSFSLLHCYLFSLSLFPPLQLSTSQPCLHLASPSWKLINKQAPKNNQALELAVDAANGCIDDTAMDMDLIIQNMEVVRVTFSPCVFTFSQLSPKHLLNQTYKNSPTPTHTCFTDTPLSYLIFILSYHSVHKARTGRQLDWQGYLLNVIRQVLASRDQDPLTRLIERDQLSCHHPHLQVVPLSPFLDQVLKDHTVILNNDRVLQPVLESDPESHQLVYLTPHHLIPSLLVEECPPKLLRLSFIQSLSSWR